MSAALVSGLVAPTAPDETRWETLWTYLISGPGVFKGDLHFYRVDSDLRGRVGAIDTARCPLYLLTGEYDFSCTPEDTLRTATLDYFTQRARTLTRESVRSVLGRRIPAEQQPEYLRRLFEDREAEAATLGVEPSIHQLIEGVERRDIVDDVEIAGNEVAEVQVFDEVAKEIPDIVRVHPGKAEVWIDEIARIAEQSARIRAEQNEFVEQRQHQLAWCCRDRVHQRDDVGDSIDESRFELAELRREIDQRDGLSREVGEHGDTCRHDIDNRLERLRELLDRGDERSDHLAEERA